MNNEPSGSRVLFPDESPIFLNGVTSCTTLFKDMEADVDVTPWHCTSANGKPQTADTGTALEKMLEWRTFPRFSICMPPLEGLKKVVYATAFSLPENHTGRLWAILES